ncbi:Hyphally regulated cell wall protein N-terminal-domain-containing protein [Scheffersomyces amazonensis]|uniref:Hyphally regulated cell wall protein N-terminal-domain-containing protein n=1 Tax=Scheffersomyces amazonensis TaxID=1078765 RepID=UPI00315D45FA
MKSSILGAVFFAVFLLHTVLSDNYTNIDVNGYYMLNITSMGQNYDCNFYANMTVHEHSTFIFNSYNFHSYGGSTFTNKGIFYSQALGAYPYYDKNVQGGSSFKLNEGQTTGGIHNTGFFMYNDNLTLCSPPTYTIHGNFFINEGTFILAGGGACDGSTNIIKPYGTNAIFHNTGVLAYMQYFMTVGDAPSTYWGSDSACTTSGVATVINNGSLCLFNNNPVYQGSQYAGNGCIDIGNQSTFFLRCPQLFGLDGSLHTFYLSTNTSVLYFDNVGVSNAPATPYIVSGWGNNNQITIHISNPVWNYDGKTLSITASSVTYQFIIGPGYDPSLISWSEGPSCNNLKNSGSRFVYNAPPPDSSRPSVCLPCPTVIPQLYDILQDQPDYTTTFTTTNSDGSVETDSGVVHVTNSDGTITTVTSLYPSEYTTTFTTTESDGFVATDSGIVFATTDKDGNHITTTSLFPTSSDPFTHYTTTFTTTDTDGFVATDSGVVDVTYNTDGEVTTKTSLFPTKTNPFTSFTTTFTTTEADGFVATDSGIVVVTYNPDGEITTKTSLFPTPTDPFTHYTTTFTTTDTDGFVATDSGVVDVTYNTDGEVTTKTSLFPTKTNPFTSFTTTFTTTEADGFVATDSGIVVVTYNPDGEITTKTSLFPTPTDPFTVYTTTFTTTLTDGFKATDSAKVVVTHNKDGEVITSSSFFPTVSDPFTVYTITWTTTYTTL